MVIDRFHPSRRSAALRLALLYALLAAGCAGNDSGDAGRNVIVATPRGAAALLPTIREDGRDVYRLAFAGGEPALVAIAAPELSTLQLSVADTSGRPLCDPVRESQRIVCEWHPAHPQEVVIEVTNTGRIELSYRLWTN